MSRDTTGRTIDAVLNPNRKKKAGGIYTSVKDGDLINPIELNDFLHGVGGVLRLPAKEEVKAPAQESKPKISFELKLSGQWRKGLIAAGILVGVIAAIPTGSGEPLAQDTLPAQVIGKWATNDSRYQGRTFEISETWVAFKNGDRADDQSVHEIKGIKTEQRGDSTLVTVQYLEAQATYELAFKYTPRPKPAIIFAHQDDMVWRRAPTSSGQQAPGS